ncbi:MAG TPA: phosphotransferase, partial [Tepidisphaeraceae bacterium]|nr:phosphotransferase [Tepidisphaeraceae bacterium]
RFAVLPSIANARWFIPLDSPSISSAAFSLYTPARASARLKCLAIRAAMRTRLPVWYRDEVLIAQRQTPPLEQMIAQLFPGTDVRLGLSAGAPEGARNRKASIAAIAADGRILAFGKLARSELAGRLLKQEAAILHRLEEPTFGVSRPAPRVVYAGEFDGGYALLQTPLAGSAPGSRLSAAHRSYLQSLQTGRTARAVETDMVADLPQRISALASHRDQLSAALGEVMPILRQVRVPVTIVHGDFAPWNVRQHRRTIAAFDWEYGQLSGLPLIDEIHFRLQVGLMLDNWSAAQGAGWLGELAAEAPLDMEPTQVRAIAVVYVLDQLARLLGEGYDATNDLVEWLLGLLALLAPCREEVVAA